MAALRSLFFGTDVLQLSKRGRRAMRRVDHAPSHAATPNSLLMY